MPQKISNKQPIFDEQYSELTKRIGKIAEKIGDKNVSNIVVLDIPIDFAAFVGNEDNKRGPTKLLVSKPFLDHLTEREQNAAFAHELEHRKDFFSENRKNMYNGTTWQETHADDKSVEEWKDPEALISGINKMRTNQLFTSLSDRDMALIAYNAGMKGSMEEYDRASPQEKEKLSKDIFSYLRKGESRDPHLPDDERIIRIGDQEIAMARREGETLPVQITERIRQTKKEFILNHVSEQAMHLQILGQMAERDSAQGRGKNEYLSREIQKELQKLEEAFSVVGKPGITFAPDLLPEKAHALGTKLLGEVDDIVNGKPGHTVEGLMKIIENETKKNGVPSAQAPSPIREEQLSPQMQEALKQFQTQASPIHATGNYLPMNKLTLPGKQIV